MEVFYAFHNPRLGFSCHLAPIHLVGADSNHVSAIKVQLELNEVVDRTLMLSYRPILEFVRPTGPRDFFTLYGTIDEAERLDAFKKSFRCTFPVNDGDTDLALRKERCLYLNNVTAYLEHDPTFSRRGQQVIITWREGFGAPAGHHILAHPVRDAVISADMERWMTFSVGARAEQTHHTTKSVDFFCVGTNSWAMIDVVPPGQWNDASTDARPISNGAKRAAARWVGASVAIEDIATIDDHLLFEKKKNFGSVVAFESPVSIHGKLGLTDDVRECIARSFSKLYRTAIRDCRWRMPLAYFVTDARRTT